jgi:hypothetical protein
MYRLELRWPDEIADGIIHVSELTALNRDAHLALWQHVLGMDLVEHLRQCFSRSTRPLSARVLVAGEQADRVTPLLRQRLLLVTELSKCIEARCLDLTQPALDPVRVLPSVALERVVVTEGGGRVHGHDPAYRRSVA